jgi:NitT/TauT family transport system substrate-binding protein
VIGASHSAAQDAPPETTTIRLAKNAGICIAPQYLADELLRAEGFTDIQYLWQPPAVLSPAIGRGEVDLSMHFSAPSILAIEAGEPITFVAGVHIGCFELFAHEGVRSIRDLKGKKVALQGLGPAPHAFLSSMAGYVGLDPAKDINWVLSPSVNPMELFVERKVDAFFGLPPEPQELRARKIGHVIVNSSIDRPWSQHYCCMLTGNRDFVRKHPAATKRVLRAILKVDRFLPQRSGGCCATNRRSRLHPPLRLCAADVARGPVQCVARVRPRGHASFLRAAVARGGHDQAQPQ